MTRAGAVAGVVLAAIGVAGAQEPEAPATPAAPASVKLPVDWAVGTRVTLERTKERVDSVGGVAVSKPGNRGRTPAEIEVRARDGARYVLRWTWGRTTVEGVADESPLVRRLNDLVADIPFDLRTDETGTPEALVDPEAARERMKGALDAIAESMTAAGEPPAQIAAFRQMAANLFRPEVIDRLAFAEPRILFLACSANLVEGEPMTFAHQLPNPFGGEPFPTKAEFRLVAVREGECEIQWTHQFDPAHTSRILTDTLRQLTVAGRAPPGDVLPSLAIGETATLVMDLATGWPRTVVHERTTTIADRKRVDRVAFRVLEVKAPPAPEPGK